MVEADVIPFTALLRSMFGLLSHGKHQPEGEHLAMWFRVLSPYSLDEVRSAMDAHMRKPATGRTLPIPADVIAQIEARGGADGRPGAEEAWSIAVACRDEAVTVVWTPEIAEAWGVALPVLRLGDEVGARMAFRQAYERLVSEVRAARRPVSWQATLGHDPEQRARAIKAAADLGRVDADAMEVASLPAPRAAVALAWSGGAVSVTGEEARQKLLSLRESMAGPRRLMEDAGISAAAVDERHRTEEQKKRWALLVSEYAEKNAIPLAMPAPASAVHAGVTTTDQPKACRRWGVDL